MFLMTWEFWSLTIFFVPILLVAGFSGQVAFRKGAREGYYLLGFCLLICAVVYANKVLRIRMTGTMGFETERGEVLAAKDETVGARDQVRQMKLEVERAQAAVTKVEGELEQLSETMYVANNIILHGMNYPLSHAFRAAAYREMKKLDKTLGKSHPELDRRVQNAIRQATLEHDRLWKEYEKIPDDNKKEQFLKDYMRKAQE